MDAAAFLLSGTRIEHMNEAARERLRREGPTTHDELVAMDREDGKATSFIISGVGLSPLRLVLLKPSSRSPERRLHELSAEWHLSPRQVDVLRFLVDGEPNKGIAAKLGCAEVTVEFHLSRLFRKSSTHTRGELIARFWSRA